MQELAQVSRCFGLLLESLSKIHEQDVEMIGQEKLAEGIYLLKYSLQTGTGLRVGLVNLHLNPDMTFNRYEEKGYEPAR